MGVAFGNRVIIGEENPNVHERLEAALRAQGYQVQNARDGDDVVGLLEEGRGCVAVLLDPGTGSETLSEIRLRWPDVPLLTVPAAAADAEPRVIPIPAPENPLPSPAVAEPWVGASASARSLRATAHRLAAADAPVLIEGETGVGKEVLARYVHALSLGSDKPFVKVNCAALTAETVDGEFFGYQGTAAAEVKPGAFELAAGGTILLDEIGDMELRLQAKLLDVLEEHKFRRPHCGRTIPVTARVIATAHPDISHAVAASKFRDDLYYRINVIHIRIPPLRERREDIPPLAETFLQKHHDRREPLPAITPSLREQLLAYSWPGNARELENAMWLLSVLRDARLLIRDLRARIRASAAGGPPVEIERPSGELPDLAQLARDTEQAGIQAIVAALDRTWWNRRKAAELLKLEYRTLLYLMKKHRIGRVG